MPNEIQLHLDVLIILISHNTSHLLCRIELRWSKCLQNSQMLPVDGFTSRYEQNLQNRHLLENQHHLGISIAQIAYNSVVLRQLYDNSSEYFFRADWQASILESYISFTYTYMGLHSQITTISCTHLVMQEYFRIYHTYINLTMKNPYI